VLLSRGNHPPFTCHDSAVTSSTTTPPTVGWATRHIVSAIMPIPLFSTLKPDVYRAWGVVEKGKLPSLYLSRPRYPILYQKIPHSCVATPGPPNISCWRLCSFPLFRLSNLGYIGRGALLSRGDRPRFTRLDPAVTSSITRSPTIGSRPRAHEAYRVGDYAHSPFLNPQT